MLSRCAVETALHGRPRVTVSVQSIRRTSSVDRGRESCCPVIERCWLEISVEVAGVTSSVNN